MDQLSAPVRRVTGFLQEEYGRAFRHEHWHIGIVDAPIHAFLERDADLDVRWLPLPDRGKYLADPFGRSRGSATDLVFEEFDFRSDKGHIAWARMEADGHMSRPRTAIDLPFHASYPFLVERSGTVYCIPETADGREVAAYRAEAFPDRWTRAAVLLPGVAALDATVVEHDGMLWLLCTDDDDGPFSKLRIWYARDLFGPWRPHAANPVKTDVGSARPAGTPFHHEGELYRPAQDCSTTYGGSVVLNRVLRLTTEEFREERAAVVGPFPDGRFPRGVHTLSSVGDRTLVDGKRFAFNRRAMARNLREAVTTRWTRTLPRR